MEIQAIRVLSENGDLAKSDAEVVRLKVSGPVDPQNAVMVRARELVLGTGSQAMIESFDWAMQHGNVFTDE
jgi:hypothetical protein